jgi:guanine nucleotide-binding protein subunit alpha
VSNAPEQLFDESVVGEEAVEAALCIKDMIMCGGSKVYNLDESLAAKIKLLWNLPEIKLVFEKKNEFHLQDSLSYFFNQVEKISVGNWVPSFKDILYCKRTTTGMNEMEYVMDNLKIKLIDVGGQRSERRKWLHHFDKCCGVIFVVAVSEYDQVLLEDGVTNRLEESLSLFDEICNCSWLSHANLILFLNKNDLFVEKLTVKKIDLKNCFSDYCGGFEYEKAIQFIQSKFVDRISNPSRQAYIHITCATDTDNVQKVFYDIHDMMLNSSVQQLMMI